MKELLIRQHCQWLFTFVWLILGLEYLHSRSLVLGLFLLVLLLRIICLKSSTLFWTLGLSLLLVVHYQSHQHQLSALQDLPIDTEIEDNYQLQVLPTDVRVADDYVSGKARLWALNQDIEAIDIQFIYWLDESMDVASDLAQVEDTASIWQVTGSLNIPEGARNFGVFDYREYLLSQGIAWTLTISEIENIQVSPSQQFTVWQANLRARLTKALRQYQDLTWVGIHNKLLFNLGSSAYQEYRQDFLALGIIHYFAISGFHLNYIRRLLSYLLLRAGVLVEIAEGLVCVLLLFYAWLVQWPAGVIRSLATFYGRRLCRKFNWPFSPLDQLALIGIIMLLFDPMLFQSVAFRLSFLMSGVIQFYQDAATYQRHEFKYSAELTLACLVFSWPLVISMNAEWNVLQFVVVLVFGLVFDRLLMPAMCVTSFVLYSLSNWSHLERILSAISHGFEWLWQFTQPVGWLAWLRVIVGVPSTSQLILLISGAVWWLFFLRDRRWLAYGVLVVSYGCALWLLPFVRLENSLVVLDVGQGDALLYRPAFSQETWLLDTGGRLVFGDEGAVLNQSAAQQDLLPALKALGVRRLTGVVISHPDADHMGNLLALSQELAIEYLLVSPYTVQSGLWQAMLPSLPEGIQVSVLPLGQAVEVPGSDFSLFTLSEQPAYYSKEASNDSSLVALFQLGALQVLNLGDLSVSGERRLLSEFPQLQADVIKVGHHGSDTSSSEALLAHHEAKVALISAGLNNRYGHPHLEVLERLAAYDLQVFATNEVGAIRLTFHPWWGYRLETALEPP